MSDQRKAVAAKLGIKETETGHELDHRSLLQSIGGWHGILESIVPGFAFVVIFAVAKQAFPAVLAGVTLSAAFIVVRAIRRQSLLNALMGLAGIALGAFLALRAGGSGRDYFITGFITNALYASALLLSVLVRYPIFGLIVGFATGEKLTWRKNKFEMRVFTAATLVAFCVFAIRLAIELPLYFANQLEALAVAKLVLGLPLYATALWLCWLLVRTVLARKSQQRQVLDPNSDR